LTEHPSSSPLQPIDCTKTASSITIDASSTSAEQMETNFANPNNTENETASNDDGFIDNHEHILCHQQLDSNMRSDEKDENGIIANLL
ncbi:unnamed protein product, partial [Didymodactylos carnosus]